MSRVPQLSLGVRRDPRKALLVALLVTAGSASSAAEIVVRVSGLSEPLGQVGCSLFAGTTGFPMDNTSARNLWLPAEAKGVTCRFNDVTEGTYAVSIGHDLNGNKRVDTDFIGLPTEQWGVSNNARLTLRAPRFEEASFKVAADAKDVVIDIKVAK
jgi:uncharacterized protein (DUF2141 family)